MDNTVITIVDTFPDNHINHGGLTLFAHNILYKVKKHTIRTNITKWSKRINEVTRGDSSLNVRSWIGTPHMSREHEYFVFYASHGVGWERLDFIDGDIDRPLISRNKSSVQVKTKELAANDGLSYIDFVNWFKDYDLTKPLIIIHFTNFRYNEK